MISEFKAIILALAVATGFENVGIAEYNLRNNDKPLSVISYTHLHSTDGFEVIARKLDYEKTRIHL